MTPKRIAVLGCSGSGKSTLAVSLAEKFGIPFVPTDHVFWTEDWKPRSAEHVRSWLEATTSAEQWVLDGNFDPYREIYWGRADLAVWLDPPWQDRVLARLAAKRGLVDIEISGLEPRAHDARQGAKRG